MVIIIEGSQGVGKTFLINSLSNKFPVYKFPYTRYFRDFLKRFPDDTGHGSREAHHHTTGYDITMLSLNKNNLLPPNLVVDRGFITNIVFSIMEGRSTVEEGMQYIDWLDAEGYLTDLHIVWMRRAPGAIMPARNKDEWEFLHQEAGYAEQDALYAKFTDYTAHRKNGAIVHEVNNNFTDADIAQFSRLMDNVIHGWQTLSENTLVHPGLYRIKVIGLEKPLTAFFDISQNAFTTFDQTWSRAEITQFKKHKDD